MSKLYSSISCKRCLVACASVLTLLPAPDASAGALDLSLGGKLWLREREGYAYQATVELSVGWEQLFFARSAQSTGAMSLEELEISRPAGSSSAFSEAPQVELLTENTTPGGAPPRPAAEVEDPRPRTLRQAPRWLEPSFAIELVNHVLRRSGRSPRALESLSTRSRTAALLPVLRLRAGRGADETLRFSPTATEPDRWLQSGRADLQYEAQATWTLDRLVFTRDEINVERLRLQLDRVLQDLAAATLKLLFRWQEARLKELDPALEPEKRVAAQLSRIQAEIELDVISGGWFSNHNQ
jgi:hypothetical protein